MEITKQPPIKPQITGLIPAGGQAKRISPLPLSKELYPIGFDSFDSGDSNNQDNLRPKVVSHYLLEKMQLAGIEKAYFILRQGKWDIPAYFGDGEMLSMSLGYLMLGLPYGVPFTLDQAYPFIRNNIIALGFPDILFQPQDAFTRLLARQKANCADVVLGLFPTTEPQKAGMVDCDAEGKVLSIVEKPLQSNLRYMWAIAVWSPVFTEFLHEYVGKLKTQSNLSQLQEVPIGDVIQAAIDVGLCVEAETFADGSYLDIGTPRDLLRAVREV
jgi:glucose-1-phosphate thymidylyltransferase